MRLSPRVALVLLAVTAAPAWGQTDVSFRDLMNARNYAMGGAFRGLALGTEMIEGNPAGVAARKRYFIELSGAWDPRSRFGFGGIGLMDSATSPIAAGVSYRYVTDNGAAFRRGNLGALALGVPVSSRLFIGASGKYVGLRGLGEKN
ncbi:MAG TPA: hypothetical protein VEY30_07965, partial [Myxococcaceae bacterium]|nr:hypothetical protein [Myxococcaceae bacterium]